MQRYCNTNAGPLLIIEQIKQESRRALQDDRHGGTQGRGIELIDVGLARIEDRVPGLVEQPLHRADAARRDVDAVLYGNENDHRRPVASTPLIEGRRQPRLVG